MRIIEQPSPNHTARRGDAPVDILLLHYTGMISREHALARLCDPAAAVSAHYLIDTRGLIYRLVAEEQRAWHAGVGFWRGAGDINSRAIGIELVNPGHEFGYRAFPLAQMRALASLAAEILARHRAITPDRVLGHSDIAPARKIDPGEKFNWAWLAERGIGLWPRLPREPDMPPAAPSPVIQSRDIVQIQRLLAEFGYQVPQSGIFGVTTRAAISAFQRHFRPWRIDGLPDRETRARLEDLLTQRDQTKQA